LSATGGRRVGRLTHAVAPSLPGAVRVLARSLTRARAGLHGIERGQAITRTRVAGTTATVVHLSSKGIRL
jgi:hypothetical protein